MFYIKLKSLDVYIYMCIRSHNMHMYDCVLMVTIYVHRGNNTHRKWRFLFILSVLEQRCELHWNAEAPNLNNGNLYSGMGLQDWFSKPVREWTPNYIVYRRGIQIPNKALGRWEHQVSAGEGALLIVPIKIVLLYHYCFPNKLCLVFGCYSHFILSFSIWFYTFSCGKSQNWPLISREERLPEMGRVWKGRT